MKYHNYFGWINCYIELLEHVLFPNYFKKEILNSKNCGGNNCDLIKNHMAVRKYILWSSKLNMFGLHDVSSA